MAYPAHDKEEKEIKELLYKNYPFKKIEEKWKERIYKVKKRKGNKKYILCMIPYPSGHLHAGHAKNYVPGDVITRFSHLEGYKVLFPFGFDSFGLPAENAAIENNISPKIWTEKNIEYMRKQIKSLGLMLDWDKEICTHSPSYYKFQQQFIIDLWNKGLVYKKEDWVNWDPIDQCVLANEQVIDGKGWRSNYPVERKKIEQWYLKITSYGEELLKDLDKLEGKWPDKVIKMQRNWIGRSEGNIISFPLVEHSSKEIEVFTTRPETVFGVTFIAISPESPLALSIDEEKTLDHIKKKKESTFLGYCYNSYNERNIPIYLANYVMDYATGAVMGCPSEDKRDREFALKEGISTIGIINKEGIMINSGLLEGKTVEEAHRIMSELLEKRVFFKLDDWGFSRNRIWGTPIPFYECINCGLLPSHDLPVLLPEEIEEGSTKGVNPLFNNNKWRNIKCGKCGSEAKREPNTMDTFIDSSWYYFRFPCLDSENKPFNKNLSFLPVDIYIGGIEHAILHLLYSRFITKALRDLGYINIDEPFEELMTQGMVCMNTYKGKDSNKYYYPHEVLRVDDKLLANGEEIIEGPPEKMSKSKKNTISIDEIIDQYGSDATRIFMLSDSPLDKDFIFNDKSLVSCWKFVKSIWELFKEINVYLEEENTKDEFYLSEADYIINEIDRSLRNKNFNITVSYYRIFFKKIREWFSESIISKEALLLVFKRFLVALWPVAPHITSELFEQIYESDISDEEWYKGKEKGDSTIQKLVLSINNKKKKIFETPLKEEEEIIKEALDLLSLKDYDKYFYIKGKGINFITKED